MLLPETFPVIRRTEKLLNPLAGKPLAFNQSQSALPLVLKFLSWYCILADGPKKEKNNTPGVGMWLGADSLPRR